MEINPFEIKALNKRNKHMKQNEKEFKGNKKKETKKFAMAMEGFEKRKKEERKRRTLGFQRSRCGNQAAHKLDLK